MLRCRLILLLLGAAPSLIHAQIDTRIDAPAAVAAFSTVRSSVFPARAGEAIVARVAGPNALNVEFSVYTAQHDLIYKEDPDKPINQDEFECKVKADGDYYVLARNISAVDGTFTIFRREGQRVFLPGGKPLATVRVYFATNRAAANPVTREPYYLNQPSPAADYSTGVCDVRIPRNHRLGDLETIAARQVDSYDDPGTDIRIMRLIVQADRNAFFADIGNRAKQSPEKPVLVFIHGFRVSFADAVRRTAQIAYDLAFPGAPVTFSWPSNESALKYSDDERRVMQAVDVLKSFLKDLSARTGATSINVMAHSMGGRLLLKTLESMAQDAAAPRLRNAILVAPDADASELRNAAGKIHKVADRLTVYASGNDVALWLSELKGNPDRAGKKIVFSADLETIDASAARTELSSFSHSYFADSPMVLSDMFHLLRGEPPGMRFGLDRICRDADCQPGQVYWRFRPTAR